MITLLPDLRTDLGDAGERRQRRVYFGAKSAANITRQQIADVKLAFQWEAWVWSLFSRWRLGPTLGKAGMGGRGGPPEDGGARAGGFRLPPQTQGERAPAQKPKGGFGGAQEWLLDLESWWP